MSPPIREGSGSSIGSIRLGDGTEISEVRTGAGDVLFSGSAIFDSAVFQLDAQAISASDGDNITTWNDTSGNNNDGTGTATYITNGINGYPSVSFDGSDDYFNVSFTEINQPFTIVLVQDFQGPFGSSDSYVYEDSTGEYYMYASGGGDGWSVSGGGQFTQTGKEVRTTIHIIIMDGSSSTIRINGSEYSHNGSTGYPISDLDIGRGNNYFNGEIGEFIIYNEALSTEQIQSEEERLNNKWGFSV